MAIFCVNWSNGVQASSRPSSFAVNHIMRCVSVGIIYPLFPIIFASNAGGMYAGNAMQIVPPSYFFFAASFLCFASATFSGNKLPRVMAFDFTGANFVKTSWTGTSTSPSPDHPILDPH